MNENLKKLMKEADYPAPEIALRAQKLAELIVRECAGVALNTGCGDIEDELLKHFGVDK